MKASIARRAALIAVIGISIPVVRTVYAGVLGGFATEWTQLANNLQLVSSYIRLGEQLQQQIKMVLDMTKNSHILPSQVFGSISSDIGRLASVVQGGQALAYSMANLDAEFRTRFRGYGYNSRTWYTDYRTWSQTSLDTTLGTLRAAGLQGQQLQSEQAVLNSLRSSLQGTDGRLEALHALGDISEQQVEQLMKLSELMMADLSSKQAYQAAIILQQAASEAAAQRFFT